MGKQSYRRNRSTQKVRQIIHGNTIHPGVHHTGLTKRKLLTKQTTTPLDTSLIFQVPCTPIYPPPLWPPQLRIQDATRRQIRQVIDFLTSTQRGKRRRSALLLYLLVSSSCSLPLRSKAKAPAFYAFLQLVVFAGPRVQALILDSKSSLSTQTQTPPHQPSASKDGLLLVPFCPPWSMFLCNQSYASYGQDFLLWATILNSTSAFCICVCVLIQRTQHK